MRFATISRIQLIIFILFLYFLNSNTRYPNKRNNLIFRQLKTTKKVWINTKIEKPYTILLSLKTTNETTTQTETNKTETNKTVDSEITEEKIESIIKEQNAILRDEMGKSKLSIKQELNRSSTEFNSQLNKSTIIVKTLIKNNHKKIKNALRKLEFQIKETSKENDDVASTILSKEISEKEEMFKELKKEIENLNQSMPIQLINKTSNSSCFSYFNCRECTKDINCGWCDLQQACVDGDELGPLFEVCSFYSYKKCNDNDCNNYNSCEVKPIFFF